MIDRPRRTGLRRFRRRSPAPYSHTRLASWTGALACGLVVFVLLASGLSGLDLARVVPSSSAAVPPEATGTGASQLAEARASLDSATPDTDNGSSPLHWTELNSSALAPSGRSGVAMAYDPRLDGVVLFGGYFVQVAPAGDTWLFQNGTWTNVSPPTGYGPAARWSATMAYDPGLGAVVLFGGRDVSQFFNDTWEFNGSGWTEIPTAAAPSPRITSMTYDPAVGGIVLFGGGIGNLPAGSGSAWTYYNDTWEFGVGGWTNVTGGLSGSPPPMTSTIAYDPATDVSMVYGGSATQTSCTVYGPETEQWSFNGTGWVDQTAQARAGPGGSLGLAGEGLAFDPGLDAMVSFGGLTRTTGGGCMSLEATWTYANGTWTNISGPFAVQPAGRQSITLVDVPSGNFVMLFGGNIDGTFDYLGDTWALSSNLTLWSIAPVRWTQLSADAPAPSPRSAAAMAYDPLLGAVVLFGGYFVQVAAAGDTWLFQNGAWTDVTPTSGSSPPARWSAAMTYDPALGKIVMFGGRDLSQFFNDTWEYGASGWSEVSSPSAPSPRLTSITYDTAIGAVVLFGGGIGNLPAGSESAWQRFSDTWEFTGAGWRNVTTDLAQSPPAMATTIVYDPNDGDAMIVGGSNAPTACVPLVEQWIFTGTSWEDQATLAPTGPGGSGGISGESMVFDSQLNAVVAFGGLIPLEPGICTVSGATWVYSNGNWTDLTGALAVSPAGRQQVQLADAPDGVLMFGGNVVYGAYTGDTWELTTGAGFGNYSGASQPTNPGGPLPFGGGSVGGGSLDVIVILVGIMVAATVVCVAIGLRGVEERRSAAPDVTGTRYQYEPDASSDYLR